MQCAHFVSIWIDVGGNDVTRHDLVASTWCLQNTMQYVFLCEIGINGLGLGVELSSRFYFSGIISETMCKCMWYTGMTIELFGTSRV
jgi:hypothetical protein